MPKLTKFELEQQILDCWGVCDDLDTVYQALYEDEHIDNDKFAHLMLGLKELYHLKFERTFATFETLLKEREL